MEKIEEKDDDIKFDFFDCEVTLPAQNKNNNNDISNPQRHSKPRRFSIKRNQHQHHGQQQQHVQLGLQQYKQEIEVLIQPELKQIQQAPQQVIQSLKRYDMKDES